MTDLSELRERLEKAEKPSRELDLQIHMEICPDEYPERWSWDDETRPPHLTSSLDAAVALVERVAGDWQWSIERLNDQYYGELAKAGNLDCIGVKASTPSLALLVALTRAMEADDDRG